MKAKDYLDEKRSKKGQSPRDFERATARSFEAALRDMGFDELHAKRLRLECDALADGGANPFAIEKHVNGRRRKLRGAELDGPPIDEANVIKEYAAAVKLTAEELAKLEAELLPNETH